MQSEKLLWLDVETSGLDPQHDYLLEVCIVVTDSNLEFLASHSCIIKHLQPVSIIQSLSSELVVQMHKDSGLWEQIPEHGIPHAEAEEALLAWVSKYVEPKEAPMCGSSVSFDRAFLREWMPKLEQYFHYRNIDVSTVKELARLWNSPAFDSRPDEKTKTHRALSDILASIAELAHYRRTFLRMT